MTWNPATTFTVASGATFQLFANTVPIDKVFVLNGDGLTNTINNGCYSVVASTDVTAATSTWTMVSSGQLDGDGPSFLVPISMTTPLRFVTIRML